MPAPARKAPAKKAAAATAARREVRAEPGTAPPVEVKFRGEQFEIPRDRLGSSRFFLRQQQMRHFGTTAERVAGLVFELLGEKDSARFIDRCGPGDNLFDVANEFIVALNKAANVPNS